MNVHHFEPYLHSAEEALEQYNTSPDWITSVERKKRLSLYGDNALAAKKWTPKILVFLKQFTDPMILLLLGCAGLARWMQDIRTAWVLALLVFVNACIWFQQEAKAERLLASLKRMIQHTAKVMVNGKMTEILAKNIVPGDIVVLNEWDAVVADVRVLECHNLQTNDFALTWESNPKKKHVHTIESQVEIADRTNLCYMGTTIATGNGLGIVVGTWMGTQLGRIASLSSNTVGEISPLQKELNHTTVILTKTTIIVWVLLFIITLLLDWELHQWLLFAVWIGASMVPQWLPAQVNIALASAASYLAKKNALVKKLSAVETLWAVSAICTDKTGTLTTNEMTVQSVRFNLKTIDVLGTWYAPEWSFSPTPSDSKGFEFFLSIWSLCNNAAIRAPDKKHPTRWVIGDPTEWALITLAEKNGISTATKNDEEELIHERSFDSSRKRMSTIRKLPNGTYRIYVKWSLQTVLPCCTSIYIDGTTTPLTEQHSQQITKRDDTQAWAAMRNLTYAYKDIDTRNELEIMSETETDLTFVGMVSMIDPPREAVKDAIAVAKQANIKIIVITWDYAKTALAIGEKVWLWSASEPILTFTWNDLSRMSNVQLSRHLQMPWSAIFSRVSPEDKVRIVSHCKTLGHIVAVTWDGVNDAPALKTAHIGVAMWKTWTDVAKEAADIILLDDSFSSLVAAISQWRVIFKNITKNILSCITTNRAELFAVLLWIAWSIFTWAQIAITAVQILAIDLLGEMWPLAALSQDPPAKGIMKASPRNVHHHIIHKNAMKDMVISGLLIGLCGYASFLLITKWGNAEWTLHMQGQTVMYISIILCQYVNILSRRIPDNNFFSPYLRANKQLLWAMGISLLLIMCIIYIPAIHVWFGFAPLPLLGWIYALWWAVVYGLWRYWVQGKGKKYFARELS